MTESRIEVQGYCDPRFAEVKAEFKRNFTQRGEIGAAVTIYHEGTLAVDLWGGIADKSTGIPWEEDTMVVVFSATKGLAAMCMHILHDRGVIDFADPVAKYWPEFAANGKEGVTIAMVMAHQAGVPVFKARVPDGAFCDWELITGMLANETPAWEPGTQHGYHAVTLGLMQGEIVRRATGKTIGQFLREEIAGPFNADIWIGLPREELQRVATSYLDAPNPESGLYKKIVNEPDSIAGRIATNAGNDITEHSINSEARRCAEIPAAGGICTARGLARAYRPLVTDGSHEGTRMVSEHMLPLMRTTRSASGKDNILQVATTFTMGFSKSWGDRRLGQGEHAILGEHAFGTVGMGGSAGFADQQAHMAFGYVMNRHGPGVALNDRGQSLIDAAYRAVGFRSSDAGFWVK